MPMGTYNNNGDNKPTSSVYSAISFSNSESNICKSKLNISYFNKLLKVGIAPKIEGNGNNTYETYDNKNQVAVYVPATKAKMLYDVMEKMKSDKTIHNVCIELTGGLLIVSDGKEYNTDSPCIIIRAIDKKTGESGCILYETKNNYEAMINVDVEKNTHGSVTFANMEIETFQNVLLQYYNASTYAIANSVVEANLYHDHSNTKLLQAIANKVGVSQGGYNSNNSKNYINGNSFSSQSSFGSDNSFDSNGGDEYSAQSFSDIANVLS